MIQWAFYERHCDPRWVQTAKSRTAKPLLIAAAISVSYVDKKGRIA